MTSNEYKAMIKASGGATPGAQRTGDRPQPLTVDEESALTKSWKNISAAAKKNSRAATATKRKKSA